MKKCWLIVNVTVTPKGKPYRVYHTIDVGVYSPNLQDAAKYHSYDEAEEVNAGLEVLEGTNVIVPHKARIEIRRAFAAALVL